MSGHACAHVCDATKALAALQQQQAAALTRIREVTNELIGMPDAFSLATLAYLVGSLASIRDALQGTTREREDA